MTFKDRAIAALREADQEAEGGRLDYLLKTATVWALIAIATELESLPKER